jgi:hypothetical protein
MVKGYIIASATLGAICLVAFVGIWLWFPKTFAKGLRSDMEAADASLAPAGSSQEEIDRARAARRAMSKGIVERALAREQALKRGEAPSEEPIVPADYYRNHADFATRYPPAPAPLPTLTERHDEDPELPKYAEAQDQAQVQVSGQPSTNRAEDRV